MADRNVKINFIAIADKIQKEHRIIYCATKGFFEYENGCYCSVNQEIIQRWILEILGTDFTIHKASEIMCLLKTKAHIPINDLNNTTFLNLKNGLFDIDNYKLFPHTPDIYSTIQLNVKHDSIAKCDKWLKTVYEVMECDEEKIEALQEFFGLCLTRETKYEKALICEGEGSNGKSVLLGILAELLGKQNYSAVPLEKFNNSHYIANLFGKLANISIETNAKTEVYDSTFKAVVSGDSIEADYKFVAPFTFNPFCKLIFAVNNMPRVDDKTSAFFRRLLILKFNKKFKEEEQNKNLKHELRIELDGIFLWLLEGLKRLRKRGYFNIGKSIQTEIEEYRKDNNNVLVFIEEECELSPELSISKQNLYDSYVQYCKDNGNRPLSKYKFGKELMKQFNFSNTERTHYGRIWAGIDTTNAGRYQNVTNVTNFS